MLAGEIARVEFSTFEMRGVVARRRVAFFGRTYDRGAAAAPPMPDFLLWLRDRVASWAEVDGASMGMALINEYRPAAPVGWHRHAPQYGIVAGTSLLSSCPLKFRAYLAPGNAAQATAAAPRRPGRHIKTA